MRNYQLYNIADRKWAYTHRAVLASNALPLNVVTLGPVLCCFSGTEITKGDISPPLSLSLSENGMRRGDPVTSRSETKIVVTKLVSCDCYLKITNPHVWKMIFTVLMLNLLNDVMVLTI